MKIIDLIDWGILPGTDITEKINRLLLENPEDAEFRFAPGVYRLSPNKAAAFSVSLSNSDQLPELKAGLLLSRMRGIRLCGRGAALLCRGQICPIAMVDSSQIEVEGLSIDFSPSHNAEGVILAASPEWADVAVDRDAYPYVIREGKLYFDCGEGYTPYFGAIEFDALTRRTACRTGDRFRSGRQEELGKGVIRFHGHFDPLPTPGNFLTLRFSPRIHPGILVHHCEDVSLDGITLYNTCGLGVLTQFCRNVRYARIQMRPNEAAGRRVLSCHDDGLHFSNNCGKITVEECYFHGLMDDPVNVHGTVIRIREITGERALTAEFAHDQSVAFPLWAQHGHEVSFIEQAAMNSLGTALVESYRLTGGNACSLSFQSDLPEGLKPGDALENLCWTASADIRGCYFGSCRARGILVATPRKVVIEDNVFESSGCAILIPGDANQWFESGACKDVTIRHNYFTDGCLISMYQFCEGIISICPEIPEPDASKPFHHNIRIQGNTFHAFGAPVLYAFCTQGLVFAGNTIIRSQAYAPWHPRGAFATLKACTDAAVENNRFLGDALSTQIAVEE